MKLRVLLALLVLFRCSLALSQIDTVSIDVPRNLAHVPWRACLSGKTSDASAELVAIVKPTEVSDYFVQAPITVSEHKYDVLLYVGRGTPGADAGKHFEIRVYSNPDQLLKEGMKLPHWPPTAKAVSPVVRVIRDDNAPSGCDGTYGKPDSSLATTDQILASDPFRKDVAPRSGWSGSRHLGWLPEVGGAVIFASVGLAFVAFAAIPGFVELRLKQVTMGLKAYRIWLTMIAIRFAVSVRWVWIWLLERACRWIPSLWGIKGYKGDLRKYATSALMVPLLFLASLWSFYANARINVKGLNALFGVEEEQADGPRPGSIVANLVPNLEGHSSEADAPATVRSPEGNSAIQIVMRLAKDLVQSFQMLWEEKYGFLAISLAGIDSAIGIVLLWRMGTEQVTALRPWHLLRDRPLVTMCFLIFNLSLVALAANRGFELAPNGVNWVLPSVISATIALVMPWIMTFMQHYAIESIADCLGPIKAVLLVASVLITTLTAISTWTLVLLFILGTLSVAFAVFFVICVTCCGFLLFAELIGTLGRMIGGALSLKMPSVRSAHLVPASLAFLILLGTGYFIIRGLMP